VTVGVENVIGEFEFLEGDGLARELFPDQRRVRVSVETSWYRRVGLAGDQPRRAMIGVAVALVVDRHDVHQHDVAGSAVHAAETHSYRRKHTSETHV